MKALNHMMSKHTPWNKGKLTGQTRDAAEKLIKQANLGGNDYLFKSQFK